MVLLGFLAIEGISQTTVLLSESQLLRIGFDEAVHEVLTAQMDPRIKFVASFIRENYQRKLTLTEMASTVNLSPWRLCHLFREGMCTSPQRFLTQVRLEKARTLIATEFLTVKEVMNQVGISDASSFGRSFKAAFGVTPSQYRNAPKSHDSNRGNEAELKAKAR